MYGYLTNLDISIIPSNVYKSIKGRGLKLLANSADLGLA